MDAFEAAADAIGARLTTSECEKLGNLFRRASEALEYLAEQPCAGDGEDDYRLDADELSELADRLETAERAYR